MGLPEDVFTSASSYLLSAYEADVAARFYNRRAFVEAQAAEAIADPTDKAKHQQRAAILSIACKLAVAERDRLIAELGPFNAPQA